MKSLNKVIRHFNFPALVALLLFIGVSNVWGFTATITRRSLSDSDWSGIVNENSSSAYITWKGNDAGQHVTFKLSGGTFKNATWKYFQSTGDQTHKLEWTVDAGYTISVTNVTLVVRSSLNGSTVKVGQADYVTNPYGGSDDFATVSSGTYSPALGNDGYVNVIFEDEYSSANNFIKTIVVTYTIEGTAQTVTYESSNSSFSGSAPYKIEKEHVDFYLNIPNWYNDGNGNFYIWNNNTTASIYWEVEQGYTIAVSGVSFNGCNAYTTSKGGFLNLTTYYHPGYSYIWSYTSSGDQSQCKIRNNKETGTDSFTQSNTTLFPSGSALGNTDYFRLCSTDKDDKSRNTGDSDWEYKIYSATLTYTINPKTYTITLDNESPTSSGSTSVTLTFDSNAHDAITNPTKDGYTFDGWWTGDNGTGSKVIDVKGNLQPNVTDGTIYTGANGVWKKDAITTLHAKWVDNSELYYVRFNGNGSISGSMANQAFVPGSAQNLTANGFAKSCTITYDANGGDAVASSVTSFAFSGWATTSAGAVAYENEEEVNNLTSTSGATVDLYAKWSAEADSVKLPMPKNDGFAFVGWYDANEDSIGTAGDTIAPTGNMTLKAHWRPGVGLTKNSITAGGDIVVTTEHVRFTMHSDGYGIVSGDDGGFKVWDDMPTNTKKNVTLTWEKTLTNGSYDINVTKITFKAKAYNSNWFNSEYGQMSFNGGSDFCIGTNSPFADKGWSDQIGGEGTYSSGVIIQLHNTKESGTTQTFDYHFKDFQIEYTITPHTPNASNTDLAGTLSLEAKQTVDVSTLFSLDHPASDFEYTYRLKEAYSNAGMDGTNFYATRSGDYEVQCCVASGDDHEASAWSTATIHVTRTCVFDNGKRAGDKDWQKTTNWDYGVKPDGTDAVRVIGDLTIDEAISVYSLSIEDTAIVNIAPEGGLTVGEGGITGATTSNLFLRASDGTDGGEKGKTGYLRVSPSYTGAMPNASVELFSEAYYDPTLTGDNAAAWQCVGAPIANSGIKAKTVYTQSWIYSWVESADDWVNNRKNLEFSPFVGYITTQDTHTEGTRLTYTGQLVSGAESVVIDLAKSGDGKGHNFLANSFAAPIDISLFDVADFYHATPTIYIRNAGTRRSSLTENQLSQSKAQAAAPGQYLAIPVTSATDLAASFDYPIVIPSMQGFWVDATDDDGTVTLNYNNLVWSADYSTHSNAALRAPKHADNEGESSQVGSLQISITADGWYDNVFMLESSRYEAAYEPGSDALKKTSGNLNIFALTENNEQLSIHATDSIIGTRIGVRTGTETAYTLIFSNIKNDAEMALWDAETQQSYAIYEGMEYTFFAEPDTIITERFKIVEYAAAPSVTTGVDQTQTETKVHKFVKDDQIFILKNGVLYNAVGVRVK